jgi:thymidine kinase
LFFKIPFPTLNFHFFLLSGLILHGTQRNAVSNEHFQNHAVLHGDFLRFSSHVHTRYSRSVPSEPFFPSGHIEVIVGPMFSGKSEELIRRVTRALIAKQRVSVFKPAIDDRYHVTHVASHAGRTAEAHAISGTLEVRRQLGLAPEPALFGETPPSTLETPLPDVIAFDEAQFFDDGLVPLALELAGAGVRVICAGLDLDFRAEPFGVMPQLLARAEHVEKLTAVCVVCGAPATRTQRLVNGVPARFDDPVILVGAAEAYEPRCRAHHEVPGRNGR